MDYYRSVIVAKAVSFLGATKGSAKHKEILAAYNGHKPLPRGVTMTVSMPCCATFVSAIAIMCNYTAIIPVECSCPQMIVLAKKMGIWQENDAYVPKPGDIILYDWQDNKTGAGDNKGEADHIGYVESVSSGMITVIEGNSGSAEKVATRKLAVDGRYIRGYICPKYTASAPQTAPAKAELCTVTVTMPVLRQGDKGPAVELMQRIIGAKPDGYFGPKTAAKLEDWQRTHPECGPIDAVVKRLTWTSLLDSLS